MKTLNAKSEFKRLKEIRTYLIVSIFISLFLSSCVVVEEPYGMDGRPGDAYLSVMWEVEPPYYLEVGTSSVPQTFIWGDYYYTIPGLYTLYYETEYETSAGWKSVAWEVDYEVWTYSGEQGSRYYDGRDGSDSYFTLECNPYGPYVSEDFYTKSIIEKDYKLLEKSENKIVIEKSNEEHGIKMTYKKVEPRNK